jgi:SP family arabinose:H+ symporter-like MFS transporter
MNSKILFISFAAALAGFLFGFDTAVISGTIELVKVQFDLSDSGVGWFVSSALLGAVSGVLFSGYLSDQYGRKFMLIASGLLFLISSIGCASSGSFSELVIYRLIGGVAFGIASMVAPLYISEISPAAQRGKLVSVYQLAITVGILLAYFSNYWTSNGSSLDGDSSDSWLNFLYKDEVWRGMFANEIYPVLLFLGCLLFIPKSPRWLLVTNREEEATKIATNYGIEMSTLTVPKNKEKISFVKLIKGLYKRPMTIAIFLMVFSQICGINAIIYYGPSILNEAGFTIGDALGGQVTIGFVNTLFTFIAIYSIDKIGRKPLLKFGATGVILSLLVVSFLFFLGHSYTNYVIIGIVLYIACYAFSLGPVQFVISTEIFPTKIRGRALTISTFFLWGTNAVVGQVFPSMLGYFGPAGTFLIFGIICLPGLLFINKFIPETKGKTLEEIQGYWVKK